MQSRKGWARVLWKVLFGFAAAFGGLLLLGVLLLVLLLRGGGCQFNPDLNANLGPGNGKHSRRLPVVVSPSTGLVDGSPVTVSSRAFAPDDVVGVTVCLGDVARRGAAACDMVSGSRFDATDSGLVARYRVPRVITVHGRPYDCATSHCWLVAASAYDYNDSGGVPISFRPGLPTVTLVAKTVRPQTSHLPIEAQPSGSIRAGTKLVVSASGFAAGEPLLVGWCSDRFAAVGPDACDAMFYGRALAAAVNDHADQLGRFTIDVSVPTTVVPSVSESVRCASRPGSCVVVIAAAADTQRSAVLPVTVMN